MKIREKVAVMFIHNIRPDILSDVILKLHPPPLETEFSIQEAGHVVIYLIQEETEVLHCFSYLLLHCVMDVLSTAFRCVF